MVTIRRLDVADEALSPPEELRPAIGLLALATDANVEAELRTLLPPTVRVYTNRVVNENPLTVESIHRTADKITEAGASLIPGQPLDALVYACTAGTAIIGTDRVEKLLRRAKPSALCTSPVHASIRAMHRLGIRRPSVLTPNVAEVNAVLARCYTSHGFDVRHVMGFEFLEDFDIARVRPETVVDAAGRSCDPHSDGLLICCTTLRVSPVLEEIERVVGRPVVTSNQAIAWELTRELGIARGPGLGSLSEMTLDVERERSPGGEIRRGSGVSP